MKQNNIKSDNYCYCKVGRAIIIWGAIEKIQYSYCNIGKMENLKAPKIIAHFGCTNIIFADCTLLYIYMIFYLLYYFTLHLYNILSIILIYCASI